MKKYVVFQKKYEIDPSGKIEVYCETDSFLSAKRKANKLDNGTDEIFILERDTHKVYENHKKKWYESYKTNDLHAIMNGEYNFWEEYK